MAAYDEESDSFLILDVNANAANWVWVKSADLIAAMRTRDESSKENRGYIAVYDWQPQQVRYLDAPDLTPGPALQ